MSVNRGGKRTVFSTLLIGWCTVLLVFALPLQSKLREVSLEWFGHRQILTGVSLTVLVVSSIIALTCYRDEIEMRVMAWYSTRTTTIRVGVWCWLAVLVVISIISTQKQLLSATTANWLAVFFTIITAPLVLVLVHRNKDCKQPQRKTKWKMSMLALIVLALLSGSLYFYHLGNRDLFEDEFQVVDAAAGYHYTGTFWKWDWVADASGRNTYCPTEPPLCHYTRAWPHSWLVAQVYRIFGISPWSSRLISAVAGMSFVLLMYGVTKYMTKSMATGFGVAVLAALTPQYVNFFRMTRMYALLLPLVLLIIYFLYRGITEEQRWYDRPWAKPWIGTWLRFHYGYLAACAVVVGIATTVHIIHLVILPGAALFAWYQYHQTHEKKYASILVATALSIGVIAIVWTTTGLLPESITQFIGFFTQSHIEYIRFIAQMPFIPVVGIGMLISAIISAPFVDDTQKRQRMVYLSSILIFGLLFYLFIARRYSSFAYILPLSVAALMLVGGMLHQLWRSTAIRPMIMRSGLTTALLLSVISIVQVKYPEIYGESNAYGKFSVIEQSIMARAKPGEAIIAQYPRRYYLQSLPKDTEVISMKYNQLYTKEQLIADVRQTGSGWILWEKRKQYHLRPSVVATIKKYFEHVNGTDIDDTNVEVYYFTSAMLPE